MRSEENMSNSSGLNLRAESTFESLKSCSNGLKS